MPFVRHAGPVKFVNASPTGKRHLLSTVKVLLQSGRLLIAEALPEGGMLVRELLSFEIEITASAHGVYDAWRESAHDDFVLAVALTWW